MINVNDVIEEKYRVDGLCSDAGGMGVVLFVTPKIEAPHKLVLKYCRDKDEEQLKRFKRETRLLASYAGNGKVVQLFDQNLNHEPPYFVMKYYPDGDLTSKRAALETSLQEQERVFLQMIDCLEQLHARNEFHRDVKPQNFLVDGDDIAVSDFGLTTAVGSGTAFTRSSAYWGTHGYIPPEFLTGGFKHADASGDIFMLGKTFYVLLTGRDPMYLVEGGIAGPVYHVIRKCCSIAKEQRYQSLAELKQSLVTAYDVMLGRGGGLGQVRQLLSAITDRLESEQKYEPQAILELVERMAMLDTPDQVQISMELPGRLFFVVRQHEVISALPSFLSVYEKKVEAQNYSWEHAEIIAEHMKVIFEGDAVPPQGKALALDLAIRAAKYMNRFAAMNTCRALVKGVTDADLAFQIASILLQERHTFIVDIEPSECRSDVIANTLRQIKAEA